MLDTITRATSGGQASSLLLSTSPDPWKWPGGGQIRSLPQACSGVALAPGAVSTALLDNALK